MPEKPTVWTIGHSNRSLPHFIELLRQHRVDVLADVRSQPFSKFTPHFNRESLQSELKAEGIRYLFMGDQLGGRPSGETFYDEEGHVLYHRLAEADFFLRGIERIEQGIQNHRVAMMCSEEDPLVCHRHRLVARVLRRRDVAVFHIRDDGSLQTYEQVEPAAHQMMLFGEMEVDAWRSLLSVLPKQPPESFLSD